MCCSPQLLLIFVLTVPQLPNPKVSRRLQRVGTKGWAGVKIIEVYTTPFVFDSLLMAPFRVLFHSITSSYRCTPALSQQRPMPLTPTF